MVSRDQCEVRAEMQVFCSLHAPVLPTMRESYVPLLCGTESRYSSCETNGVCTR